MITYSKLESSRFGIKTGKLEIGSEDEVGNELNSARIGDYKFLTCRVPAAKIFVVQELEKNGFFVTDTLVYYEKRIPSQKSALGLEFALISSRPSLAPQIVSITEAAFMGYPSHYKFDRKISQNLVDEIYPDWARRCCEDREMAAEVISYVEGDVVWGYIAVKKTDKGLDVPLAAVHPAYQGRGVFRKLLQASAQWASANDFNEITYSTQLMNLAPQRALVREMWEPSRAYYTLHAWL